MLRQQVDNSMVKKLRDAIDGLVWEKMKGKNGNAQKTIKKLDKELQSEDLPVERQRELKRKRAEIFKKEIREPWLEKTSLLCDKVFIVTHAPKFTHSSISGADGIFFDGGPAGRDSYVGTHVLGAHIPEDWVSNTSANLGLASLLMLENDGMKIMDLVEARDEALIQALSDDRRKAEQWVERLASVAKGDRQMAAHTLAKQVFFPVAGEDSYHLISPVFPSSLVQVVKERIERHRFSEPAKKAREAKKNGVKSEIGYVEYPDIVIQEIGGDNAQNISHLNAKRSGRNILLPSFPPTWGAVVRPPVNTKTVFGAWLMRRRDVRQLIQSLAHFLATTEYNNVEIRRKRAEMVNLIVDAVLQVRAEMTQLQRAWSVNEKCTLNRYECLWLDPDRAEADETFAQERAEGKWRSEVSRRFANWLNRQIRYQSKSYSNLPLGDAEFREWKKVFEQQIQLFEEEFGYE